MWRRTPETDQWEFTSIQGAWTPRLDWTGKWAGYAGLGDFVQPLAARFENVLKDASVSGPLRVATEHVLDNQTQLNWQDHPWNGTNGGHLDEPGQMWAEDEWVELIARRAVYLWHRYGAYPQATGLYLDITRASPSHVEWIQQLVERLHHELPGVPVYCPSPGLPERHTLGMVHGGKKGWHSPDGLPGAGTFVQENDSSGVTLVGASEEGFDANIRHMQHWSQQEVLRLDVEPQFSQGIHPVVQMHVRTAPDRVFASKILPLHNREPNRVFVPLDDPDFWTCFQEPEREWTPLERMTISEVTLRVFSDRPDPDARFYLREVATVSHPLTKTDAPPQVTLSGLEAPDGEVAVMERQQWRFDLDRFFQNPYDPDEIAVDLEVILPDGTSVSHPGFFHQEVNRHYEDEVERWELGTGFDWRVRFRPWQAGTHAWTLKIVYHPPGEQTAVQLERTGQFEALATESFKKGFLLQSKRDPRYFEFQNGEFFYPIGHTMRSPTDRREGIYDEALEQSLDAADAKGTELYADWFRRMQANGGNFARIWMSNWWLGLEWNSRHSGYHGRSYFNQQNAARLDRLLELAEAHGVYLNIETINHGTFSSTTDGEWQDNPWSAFSPDEGPIQYASEFCQDEEATRWHRNKIRYLIA
nr:hypothetical protein [Kiritimatiellia bacterium]